VVAVRAALPPPRRRHRRLTVAFLATILSAWVAAARFD
jgi:hypothetical protein